ncbi:MAG: hypothetical protein Q9161_002992 [Pseudevernia consocians]
MIKEFFLSNCIKIEFGTAQGFGKGADSDEEPPDFGAKACGVFETKSLATLLENLRKVKWEVFGIYKRYDLPSVLAEEDRQKEEAQAKNQGDEPYSDAQSPNADREHGKGDDNLIEGDDGVVVQNGNLMKDGVVIANGAVFETELLLEYGRRVGDSAGDLIIGNGENGDMMLDGGIHTAAGDMVIDDDEAIDDDKAVGDDMTVDNEMMP